MQTAKMIALSLLQRFLFSNFGGTIMIDPIRDAYERGFLKGHEKGELIGSLYGIIIGGVSCLIIIWVMGFLHR